MSRVAVLTNPPRSFHLTKSSASRKDESPARALHIAVQVRCVVTYCFGAVQRLAPREFVVDLSQPCVTGRTESRQGRSGLLCASRHAGRARALRAGKPTVAQRFTAVPGEVRVRADPIGLGWLEGGRPRGGRVLWVPPPREATRGSSRRCGARSRRWQNCFRMFAVRGAARSRPPIGRDRWLGVSMKSAGSFLCISRARLSAAPGSA